MLPRSRAEATSASASLLDADQTSEAEARADKNSHSSSTTGPPPRNRASSTQASLLRELRQLIQDSLANDNWRLPPETALSRKLGVGRSKLREALAKLEAEGMVTRRRRSGTTINWGPHALHYPAGLVLALSDFLDQGGISYAIRDLAIRQEPTPEGFGNILLDGHVTSVFNISRVYEVDNTPAAYIQHYLPVELDGHPVRIEAFRADVIRFLQDVEGVRLDDGRSTIAAEPALGVVAGRLGLTDGSPVLAVYSTLFDEHKRVVTVGRGYFRSDVISLTVSRHGLPSLAGHRAGTSGSGM